MKIQFNITDMAEAFDAGQIRGESLDEHSLPFSEWLLAYIQSEHSTLLENNNLE